MIAASRPTNPAQRREALLESLAVSRGGAKLRSAALLIATIPVAFVLGAPLLLLWLAALLLWNGVLIKPLERHWVLPAIDTDLTAARLRRASMVTFGLALTQVLPIVAWSTGTAFGALVGAAWALSSATQVFVYYSRDRWLLIAGIAPTALAAIAGPILFFGGITWESAVSAVFLLFTMAVGAAFVTRSDALIAQAAEEAAARLNAEAASTAKSRFIANMHHELRTPLNAIIGYSEIMRENALDEARNADVADLDRVLAAARLQLMMMSDLLAFSELQDGRIELEPHAFDAGVLVSETAEALRAAVEANGNQLVVDIGPDLAIAHNDPSKLRHCLQHLISNAGKFTRDGAVTLRARREHNERGAWLVFTVADTGVGIPPERIHAIFEPFTQADESATRGFEGAGVGLAITARIARLLGGAVSVESRPGQGAVFTLRIRADIAARPEAQAVA